MTRTAQARTSPPTATSAGAARPHSSAATSPTGSSAPPRFGSPRPAAPPPPGCTASPGARPVFGIAVHCLDVPFLFDCLDAERVDASPAPTRPRPSPTRCTAVRSRSSPRATRAGRASRMPGHRARLRRAIRGRPRRLRGGAPTRRSLTPASRAPNGVRDPPRHAQHACDMTNVGETSVPTTTGPLAAHREHSILVLEHLVTHGPATRSELATATGMVAARSPGSPHASSMPACCRPAEHDPTGDGRATPLSLSAADHVLVTTLLRHDEAVATVAGLSGEELDASRSPSTKNPTTIRPAPPRPGPSARSPSHSTAPSRVPSARSIRSPTSRCSSPARSRARRPS